MMLLNIYIYIYIYRKERERGKMFLIGSDLFHGAVDEVC